MRIIETWSGSRIPSQIIAPTHEPCVMTTRTLALVSKLHPILYPWKCSIFCWSVACMTLTTLTYNGRRENIRKFIHILWHPAIIHNFLIKISFLSAITTITIATIIVICYPLSNQPSTSNMTALYSHFQWRSMLSTW